MSIEPIIGYKAFFLGWIVLMLLMAFACDLIIKHQEKTDKVKSPSDAGTSNEPIKRNVS